MVERQHFIMVATLLLFHWLSNTKWLCRIKGRKANQHTHMPQVQKEVNVEMCAEMASDKHKPQIAPFSKYNQISPLYLQQEGYTSELSEKANNRRQCRKRFQTLYTVTYFCSGMINDAMKRLNNGIGEGGDKRLGQGRDTQIERNKLFREENCPDWPSRCEAPFCVQKLLRYGCIYKLSVSANIFFPFAI